MSGKGDVRRPERYAPPLTHKIYCAACEKVHNAPKCEPPAR